MKTCISSQCTEMFLKLTCEDHASKLSIIFLFEQIHQEYMHLKDIHCIIWIYVISNIFVSLP